MTFPYLLMSSRIIQSTWRSSVSFQRVWCDCRKPVSAAACCHCEGSQPEKEVGYGQKRMSRGNVREIELEPWSNHIWSQHTSSLYIYDLNWYESDFLSLASASIWSDTHEGSILQADFEMPVRCLKWCCQLPVVLESVFLINMCTLCAFKTVNHEFGKYFCPIFCFHFGFVYHGCWHSKCF